MKNRCTEFILCCITVISLTVIPSGVSLAEPVDQTITLKPGWNAVFLEVDPEPSDSAKVFKGIDNLISVWTWISRVSTVEYIQDPNTLIPNQPGWLVYLPESQIVTNLHAIYGETPYLINLGGTEEVQWKVTGEPRLPRIKWKADSFNLVGFHLDPGWEPYFEDFFAASTAHAGQDIYILNNLGEWQRVTRPALTQMRQGESFWVFCKGHSDYQGPFSVQLDSSNGLHFGKALSEQNIRLTNNSAMDISLTLRLEGQKSELMQYWYQDLDTDNFGWKNYPLNNLALTAGQRQSICMGVRRSGLNPDTRYTSNLVVEDDAGMRIIVPASVEGISHAGLWVGSALIRKVSEPRVDPDTLYPTGSELSFRLILHVNDSGQVRLLKQAIQMWDEKSEQYVLFTDDNLISGYLGSSSEQSSGMRRISSAAFSRLSETDTERWEKPMIGSFNESNGSLSCTIKVSKDDPLNPFYHKYHHEHGKREKAYEVTREIEMDFSQNDSDGNPITSDAVITWGGSDMGGIYRETLTGLHKAPIKVEGVFLLHKVSSVETLTRLPKK